MAKLVTGERKPATGRDVLPKVPDFARDQCLVLYLGHDCDVSFLTHEFLFEKFGDLQNV
ncbi:hypothetical protein ACFC8N_23900 [Streptomyces sp. NPDC055966]|uniref:hypothetical protein n=1 Tax=Streptomyces sp. NPDC055966 TaxID=3345669 RepID=UPI0035D6D777